MPRKRPPAMSAAQLEQVENKITEWSEEKIQKLMNDTFRHHKEELMIALGAAILSILVGTGCVIWSENPKTIAIGIFCFIAGVAGIFVYLIKAPKKTYKQQSEYAKEALRKEPLNLVWAYVLVEKKDNSTEHFWMLNFRNGMCVKIPQNVINRDVREYLCEKNIQGFIAALRRINPSIVIGFSDEIKGMYSKGLL